MTTKQLQDLADGIKKPNLKNSEIINLLDREDFDFMPMDKKQVAQEKTQKVAQSVAQVSWVAQERPQMVAQSKSQRVAQEIPQKVLQFKQGNTLLDKDIERFKEELYLLNTIEERKRFVANIGFGLAVEKRNKQYYYYGIKKMEGKKYRLYIGNVKS